MRAMNGRTTTINWTRALITDVWRVGPMLGADRPDRVAYILDAGVRQVESKSTGDLYLALSPRSDLPGRTIVLPESLAHVGPDDVLAIAPDGQKVSVLWKAGAKHNSLLLTEQCDNCCIMCSQPPKERDDSWLFERAKRVIDCLPRSAETIGLTGGEPTLNEDSLIDLLQHCKGGAPSLEVHLLSNGRRFSRPGFAARYAAVGLDDIMVGIPLYAPEPGLHDFIVQSMGAFDETVLGILNLAALRQRIEIRIVLQRHTIPTLASLTAYISRNLPFVDQVVLMGLEMTGLARPNSAEVWIDPIDYQSQLREAALTLVRSRIVTKIYNHQLCVLDRELWPFAVQSISEWKNDYLDICTDCSLRDACGGVFVSGSGRVSEHLATL